MRSLLEIKDPKSASALIDAITVHPELTQELLLGLSSLGGRLALAYLFTVKNGHNRANVRAMASEAFHSLVTRDGWPENESLREN